MPTNSLFENRYPELTFLLQCLPCSPQESSSALFDVDLEGIEILFCYGVGNGALYHQVKGWLHEKPERDLVFIEDDPSVLLALADGALIDDPQVHIRFQMEGVSLDQMVTETAHQFPIHRMQVLCHPSKNKRRFDRFSLALKRAVTLEHALFNEDFYYHELFKNLVPNFMRMPYAGYVHRLKGAFEGLPAIVCGAGPSLDAMLPLLQTLENKALIIAGGSTITALTQRGVIPHIGVAIDPNPEEYERLKDHRAQGMPLIFAPRVNQRIFETFAPPLGYLRSFTGGAVEQWLEERLGFDDPPLQKLINREALSVTTTCISLAHFLGCCSLALCGIDLAYTGLKRYASGVMEESHVALAALKSEKRIAEGYLRRKGQRGEMVHTQVKWVMESNWISLFAQHHSDMPTINLSQEGLGFKGIPCGTLPELKKNGKLRAKVLESFERAKIGDVDIQTPLNELKKSFFACADAIDMMSREPKLACLAHLELEGEIAYQLALAPYWCRLQFALKRRMREATEAEIEERSLPYLKVVCQDYLATLTRHGI